jgi:hypothetical protein
MIAILFVLCFSSANDHDGGKMHFIEWIIVNNYVKTK